VAVKKYEFKFTKEFGKVFRIQFAIGVLCFISVKLLKAPYVYIPGSILIIFSTWFSLNELNKRMELITLIKSKIGRGK